MAEVTKKKHSFDASFKLKVVSFTESHTNRSAARRFSVDEKNVMERRKKKDAIERLPCKKMRLEGGGCKAAHPGMEEELVSWIENLRAHNSRVTRSGIQSKALELAQGNKY